MHPCFTDAVYLDSDPVVPDTVAEEVIIDSDGGQSESVHSARAHEEDDIVSELEAGSFVEVKEEDNKYGVPSDEMSVAINLAKLSQGYFSNGDVASATSRRKISADTNSDTQYVFFTEDGKEAQCLEDIEGRTVHVADLYAKPKMSYAQLIAEALMNSSEGMLTLSDIYQAIAKKHPFYKTNERNWQNSIRHNLTLNKSFKKLPRESNEGRGSFWTLVPGGEAEIFRWKNRQSGGTPRRTKEKSPTFVVESEGQIVEEEVVNHFISDSPSSSDQIIYVTIPS